MTVDVIDSFTPLQECTSPLQPLSVCFQNMSDSGSLRLENC